MVAAPWLAAVLVCCAAATKVPQTGVAETALLPSLLEAANSKFKVPAALVSAEPSSRFTDGRLLAVLTGQKGPERASWGLS